MAYLEFEIPVLSWSSTEKEILCAKLAESGFEGFVEGEEQLQAYIDESSYSSELFSRLLEELQEGGLKVQYRYHVLSEQNWNEEWESKFQPVEVSERVLIRAPFHASANDRELTLVIEPKMSFGTGHHHTTRLMIKAMEGLELKSLRVLDMGTGTGVLGIYACKRGASRVLGIDNDQWAYENALENLDRNQAGLMEVLLGDASTLGAERFDLILANITRNILIRDMEHYVNCLEQGGLLLLSGFLSEDVLYVFNETHRFGLEHLETWEESGWMALLFKRAETAP